MSDPDNPNTENVNADLWIQWLKDAQRYEHNWQVRKAIAAIRPAKKKRQIQMPGMPSLDLQARDPEHPTDGVVS